MLQRVMSRFSVEVFCLTVPRTFVGHVLGCHYFRVSKIFMLQRVMSRFSFEFFLSHSAEKFRRGTLLCCVSESFRYRLSLRIRRGKISRFSVEKFLSHSVEKLGR